MSTVSKPRSPRTTRRGLADIALISSGGYTFPVERRIAQHDDGPLEIYTVSVPPEEGELRIARCGLHNDGPFGLEFESNSRTALPVDRELWWVHALHATARLAEQLNDRADRR